MALALIALRRHARETRKQIGASGGRNIERTLHLRDHAKSRTLAPGWIAVDVSLDKKQRTL